ncbi:LysR family transcriptional regulator [Marinomonas sp. M1K-6]|uniref:LysR family transcriptional regulator n=1 Tax=Marinomonas profundi TaxID=2726122 RepID=A0A847QVX6_9GAMM|nr:LysR family transcriptional regulator [Marinomonas profundi]NLQ17318.1 LysR family transcriptional regulator [Marinomonas profundi]UDV01846.1 LysR family transcriptional regulator [Marinomonas profundi]
MIDKLEIHHLRTLSALYQFGNISAAAEHLSVSQQAISLQLKKIRAILEDPLFVRTGHGMMPTTYAKEIEPHIQQILIQIHNIPLANTFSPQEIARTLVICATDYTQEVIVTELIRELRQYAPKVKVIVTNIEHVNLTKKIHQGSIDIVFTTSVYAPEGLISTPLFTEKYLCVTTNKAIERTHNLSLEQLTKHDFVIVSPGVGSFIGSADTWFEQQGFPRHVAVSAPSFHMAKETLKQSNMVGFIPSRLLPYDGLFELPLEKYPPGYQVVAAYHPGAKHDPLIRWLLDSIQNKFTN